MTTRALGRSAPEHFAFADALRAFAILLVVLNHVFAFAPPHFLGRTHNLDALGIWGVNCFFVLSGFLLAGPYLAGIMNPGMKLPSTRLFLTRRFLRIYPLYAASIVFSVLLLKLNGVPMPSSADIVSHLFMLQDFSPSTVFTINAPLWTMPVDAQFYFVLPLLAAGLGAMCVNASRSRVGWVTMVLVGIALLGVLSRLAVTIVAPAVMHSDELLFLYLRNALGMAPAFCIGILLALNGSARNRRLPIWLAVCLLFVALAAARIFDYLQGSSNEHINFIFVVTYDALAAISVGLIVFVVSHPWPPVVRAARMRIVRWAAGISYAVYLFHMPILTTVARVSTLHHGRMFFGLAITVGIAALAHHFIEEPFLRLKSTLRDGAVSPSGLLATSASEARAAV